MDPQTGEEMRKRSNDGGWEPRWDNQLTIMHDAKLAAIDHRLIRGLSDLPDWEGSRVNKTADIVADFYQKHTEKTETTPEKGVAMVFLDYGTPKEPPPLSFLAGAEAAGEATVETKPPAEDEDAAEESYVDESGIDLYAEVKAALVKRGIPEDQIAYVQQAKKDAERAALFDAVNSGRVRVLLGSTEVGGEGVNVQERLGLMVHMDVPRAMRPGDFIQRIGRIVRRGNLFSKVRVVRFITRGTTDEWLYGELIAKQNFITGFWKGERNTYEDRDVGSGGDLEEAQRLATGDPRALRLMDLRDEQVKLKQRLEAQDRLRMRTASEIRRLEATIRHESATSPT